MLSLELGVLAGQGGPPQLDCRPAALALVLGPMIFTTTRTWLLGLTLSLGASAYPFPQDSAVPALGDRTVLVPGAPLEILFEDAGEKTNLALTVVDARTGARVIQARSRLHFDEGSRGRPGSGDDDIVWNDIALQSEPYWPVEAPPYLPASALPHQPCYRAGPVASSRMLPERSAPSVLRLESCRGSFAPSPSTSIRARCAWARARPMPRATELRGLTP